MDVVPIHDRREKRSIKVDRKIRECDRDSICDANDSNVRVTVDTPSFLEQRARMIHLGKSDARGTSIAVKLQVWKNTTISRDHHEKRSVAYYFGCINSRRKS